MKIIGITGSSGAGKTTICKLLEEKYKAETINADEVAKELSIKGTMYLTAIVRYFGNSIVNNRGELNREKLANIIFSDDKKREELNNLTFMYVVDEIKRRINDRTYKEVMIVDAPLLYESGLSQICDCVVAVIADRYKQIARITLRDELTREEAEKRLNAQNSNEFFTENADYVIYNNGDMDTLTEEINKIEI